MLLGGVIALGGPLGWAHSQASLQKVLSGTNAPKAAYGKTIDNIDMCPPDRNKRLKLIPPYRMLLRFWGGKGRTGTKKKRLKISIFLPRYGQILTRRVRVLGVRSSHCRRRVFLKDVHIASLTVLAC